MVRGRVKGKKQNIISAHEDPGSTEGHKIPPNRRRGRPQKPLKDDIGDGNALKIEDEGEKSHISRKDVKNHSGIENGTKRKRSAHVNENMNKGQEENKIEINQALMILQSLLGSDKVGVGGKTSLTGLLKLVFSANESNLAIVMLAHVLFHQWLNQKHEKGLSGSLIIP